tara:strand:+ start:2083 stop:2757 length:675 start_codon:yes stop_codon:yes gene_type:complete
MAHRLLPFRQYDENDVVNLFALDADSLTTQLKAMSPKDDGINADGVLVGVTAGNLGGAGNVGDPDVVDVSEDSRFMASYTSPVGRNPYPTNPLKVAPGSSGTAALGVTLRQTLSVDENGESLLFNPIKKDELNAVLSGQTVPVLSKGVITVSANGMSDTAENTFAVGGALAQDGNGKFCDKQSSDVQVGSIMGTGFRGGNKDSNFGGIRADSLSGKYYLIKLDC